MEGGKEGGGNEPETRSAEERGGREGELEGGSALDRVTASAAAVIDISIFNWLSSAKLEGGGKGEERCRRDH